MSVIQSSGVSTLQFLGNSAGPVLTSTGSHYSGVSVGRGSFAFSYMYICTEQGKA